MILTGTTTLGQREPGSNDNERVFHIPQTSEDGASPSDGVMSYLEHSLGGGLTPLPRCSRCILLPQLQETIFNPNNWYFYLLLKVLKY